MHVPSGQRHYTDAAHFRQRTEEAAMLDDHLAREIIRERVAARKNLRRPTHPKAAGVLRRLAERMEGDT